MQFGARKPYPSDATDEWAFVAPYLTLMDEVGPLRCQERRHTPTLLLGKRFYSSR